MKRTFTGYWMYFSPDLRPFLFALVMVLPARSLLGQTDSLITSRDSIPLEKGKVQFRPVPQRAALLSLIPGGGQLYNRRYWKVPIVYGVMGGLFFLAEDNRKEYVRFRDAYQKELAGEPHDFPGVSATVLRNNRDIWHKNMEEAYIFLGLTYLIQIAEAYVDAHLQDFDISDDLSASWKPVVSPGPGGMVPGIGLVIRPSIRAVLP